jgi:hypothetical protein
MLIMVLKEDKTIDNHRSFLDYFNIKFQDVYFASFEDFHALQEDDQHVHHILILTVFKNSSYTLFYIFPILYFCKYIFFMCY